MVLGLDKLLILDGNSIVNRAFYGVRLLTNKDGLYTNAIYGFLNILFKYITDVNPTHICVAFDVHAPTFRHKSFEYYKAQRKGMPDELSQQMPVLKEVLSAMNIKMYEISGFEADDIIGTVSFECDKLNVPCFILTGDKDDLQLASQNTTIKLITTKGGSTDTTDYNDKTVFEKYGVAPSEFIDVKGLMGDSSDNIPGVSGIGEKTALSLVKEFHSIEKIYESIEEKNISKSVKNKLVLNKQSAFDSKYLATIVRDVPIGFCLDDCIIKEYDSEKLTQILTDLNFTSFLKKFSLETKKEEESVKIYDDTDLILNKAKEKGILYFAEDNGEYYASTDEYDITKIKIEDLYPLFSNPDIKKISHDLKSVMVKLCKDGRNFENAYFDTMIAYYIINPSASEYSLDSVRTDTISTKSDNLLYDIIKIHKYLTGKIEDNKQENLFYNIEMPLVEVLASMQYEGVSVDRDSLVVFQKMLGEKIDEITDEIYSYSGEEFNINSPKQLGIVLFEKLHLPVIKKTKTGYSTNVEVLEKLRGTHEIIDLIMEYRHLVKLKGTYADGLLNVIDKKTGKIYSNFNQTVTATGRISSTEPNLQNIPVRTELGREVRKMFVSSGEERILVDADYSQIELRVLSHISNDENMLYAFNHNEDIHKMTASQIFGVDISEVTSTMRSRAKTINFGIIYGMGDFTLSQELKIRRKDAKEYINNYFERFSGVKNYMDSVVKTAEEQGYVTTLFNRRRYLPELKGNFIQRSFGERVAMNTPIQGTAADIIKIAMNNVYYRLKKEKLKSKLILQVHDELIIDAYIDELDKVREILKFEMENAVKLNVPLVTDMNTGRTWYDAK